jgi:hypothetical protein
MNTCFVSIFRWRFSHCSMAFWLSILTIFLAQPIWAQEAGKNLPVRPATDPFAWIYFYYYILAGGVVILLGLLFFKNLSKRKIPSAVRQNGQQSFAATSELSKNGNGLKGMKLSGSNGHIARRKRALSFGKFYTNMILELSLTDCEGKIIKNGNGGGHALKSPSKLNGASSDPAITSANLDLITGQTQLIEEQRRFMQQQSKLIDEKTQLIKDQSQLLGRQSGVMEGQYSFELRYP